MNIPRLAPLFAALLMLGLTSCPETHVPRNFGVKPAVLKPAAWEGDWSEAGSADEAGHFAIKEASQGVLTVTTRDKDKKESAFEAIIRHASAEKGSKLFFVTWFEKPGDSLGTVNLMSKSDDDVFYVWHPNHAAIEKAVSSGKLKGKVTKNKDDADTEIAAEASNYSTLTRPEFWDWTSPTAYFKHRRSKVK